MGDQGRLVIQHGKCVALQNEHGTKGEIAMDEKERGQVANLMWNLKALCNSDMRSIWFLNFSWKFFDNQTGYIL